MTITCSTKVDQLFLSTGAGLNHFLLTRPVAFGNDIALHLTFICHYATLTFTILPVLYNSPTRTPPAAAAISSA